MKKLFITLSMLLGFLVAHAQEASDFGPNDILIADFETTDAFFVDSLWLDSTDMKKPVIIPSQAVTIVDNDFPMENVSEKTAYWVRPKGGYKALNMRFDRTVNFAKTPYLQVQIMPEYGNAPAATKVDFKFQNDKEEISVVTQSQSGLEAGVWTTVTFDLRKLKMSEKYNTITLLINSNDAMAKEQDTGYYIDQIGFKATDEEIPATVFYESFGPYNAAWGGGKLPKQSQAEFGSAELYRDSVGFFSDLNYDWLNKDGQSDTLRIRSWGMASKYKGYSGDARLGLNPNDCKGAFYTGNINVADYKNMNFSFGFATQVWYKFQEKIALAQPKVEISVDEGPFYEIYTESTFLQQNGEEHADWDVENPNSLSPVYEDELFILLDYPIVSETNTPITDAETINIRLSYKAGSEQQWVDDLWLAGEIKEGTGISVNKNDTQIKVYPNPATDRITVAGATKLDITDLNGRLLISTKDVESVDVSTLSIGVYFVKATIDNNVSVLKFIKR